MLTVIITLAVVLVSYYVLSRVFFPEEIKAAIERDPAAAGPAEVVFTYSGFHALVFYRAARFLLGLGTPFLPRMVSQVGRLVTGIEIHPGARIGKGLFIDHGMGVVIGETTIVGDNVTLFQGVTLGGTGKETGKRHPTIGNDVVIGAGAKVLGDIRVGDNVNVGANAVVLRDVPDDSTVVGVPGRVAKKKGKRLPGGVNLDHSSLPDPLQQALEKLQHEIDHIEHEIAEYHESKGNNRG
ncbi:MAG: serine O-acetyltransferase [Candidatus Omnitrophica bacterium]|nr:serine O-acetyltransferase [Candidatus Omnitrophota bacterium]